MTPTLGRPSTLEELIERKQHLDYAYCMQCGSALYETIKRTSYSIQSGEPRLTKFRKCPNKRWWNLHDDLRFDNILGWYNRASFGSLW